MGNESRGRDVGEVVEGWACATVIMLPSAPSHCSSHSRELNGPQEHLEQGRGSASNIAGNYWINTFELVPVYGHRGVVISAAVGCQQTVDGNGCSNNGEGKSMARP